MGTSTKIDWNRPQPAPNKIARYLRANFPQITETGIYNPRNIAGTSVRSAHAEGRALDIHLSVNRPEEKLVGDQLFHALIEAARQTGIDNVIWNRQIWSVQQGGPRPFVGKYKNGAAKNPHTNHIHVEFTRSGSQQQVFNLLELKIAIIRTGLEDLSKSRQNIG